MATPDPENPEMSQQERGSAVIGKWHDPPIEADEDERLGEDVYSLIFIAPVRGRTFTFALFVIFLKITLMALLALDLHDKAQGKFTNPKKLVIRATQFLLIPVAVAMQEDLMTVFTRIANLKYNPKILEVSPYATPAKFSLSFLLRFVDGLLSLSLNFILLLITEDVLALFLNFAALGFLQSIDDVAFSLVANGYMGDRMESRADLVSQTTLPKRLNDKFTNSLDTILFFSTMFMMWGIYIYIVLIEKDMV